MNNGNMSRAVISTVILLAALTTGCATTSQVDGANDPLQPVNEVFYGINDTLDRAFMQPIAEAYVEFLPDGIRSGVTNFFDNLYYPGVVINDLLQGKFEQGFSDAGRFVVNSTLGIGGLFDPATSMGLERHEEDFGQTLGTWGAGEGAYLVLPLGGPNSVRDAPDLVLSTFTNVMYYVESSLLLPLGVVKAVDDRANLLSATRLRDKTALDPYVFTRTAYRQRRTHLIYDGNPPIEDYNGLEDYEELP